MSANLRQNGQPYLRATTLTENLKTLSKAIFPRFQTAANTCKLNDVLWKDITTKCRLTRHLKTTPTREHGSPAETKPYSTIRAQG